MGLLFLCEMSSCMFFCMFLALQLTDFQFIPESRLAPKPGAIPGYATPRVFDFQVFRPLFCDSASI